MDHKFPSPIEIIQQSSEPNGFPNSLKGLTGIILSWEENGQAMKLPWWILFDYRVVGHWNFHVKLTCQYLNGRLIVATWSASPLTTFTFNGKLSTLVKMLLLDHVGRMAKLTMVVWVLIYLWMGLALLLFCFSSPLSHIMAVPSLYKHGINCDYHHAFFCLKCSMSISQFDCPTSFAWNTNMR